MKAADATWKIIPWEAGTFGIAVTWPSGHSAAWEINPKILIEAAALAIERADNQPCDGACPIDHPEISDWGWHLATAAIGAALDALIAGAPGMKGALPFPNDRR